MVGLTREDAVVGSPLFFLSGVGQEGTATRFRVYAEGTSEWAS